MADEPYTKIISRQEAKGKGLQRYFTGKSCPHQHIAERYVSDRGCVSCAEERRRTPEYKEILRIAVANYGATERGKENLRSCGLRYRRSSKGRATIRRRRGRPESKAKEKIYMDKYNKIYRTTETGKANRKKYRNSLNGIEYHREGNNRYRATERGKEVHRVSEHRRRARKLQNGGDLSADEIALLKKRQKRCYLCDAKFTKKNPATIEHIIPLSKGGSNDITNVMLACGSCNSSKLAKILQLL